MDYLQPAIADVDQAIDEISKHNQLKHDYQIIGICIRLQKKVRNLNRVVGERFCTFSQ